MTPKPSPSLLKSYAPATLLKGERSGTMPRLFYGNFDCEYDWSTALAAAQGGGSLRGSTSAVASRHSAGLAPAWLAVCDSHDFVAGDPAWNAAAFADLGRLGVALPRFVAGPADVSSSHRPAELVPWGWTETAARLADSLGRSVLFPPPVIVAEVNRREFRFCLEQQFNVAPEGSGVARTVGELNALLQHPVLENSGWILKANFGMAGREALRGRGRSLAESQHRWVASRLETMGPVVVEPRLDAKAEAGIQLQISRSGEIELLGVAEQIVVAGSWRGSRFEAGDRTVTEWSDAVAIARLVAAKVWNAGYFGPLGIDAMRYRDVTGQVRLRPLQDLNARHTMGRLTLGWRHLLPPGGCGTWLHLDAAHCGHQWFRALADIEGATAGRARGIVTSPVSGESPLTSRVSVLVLATDREFRSFGEAALVPVT